MRVTCGSAVISHEGESESPSPEERDWKDDAADDSGGNMRSLSVLERHRGVGMESFQDMVVRTGTKGSGRYSPTTGPSEGESDRAQPC